MNRLRKRWHNPTTVLSGGPRAYSGVQRLSAPAVGSNNGGPTRLPGRSRHGWGGWWGGGCGWGACGFWPGLQPAPFPVPIVTCPSPIIDGYLAVSGAWVVECFWPTYLNARTIWGGNADAISSEIYLQLLPPSPLQGPSTGAERELRRRIDLATAILLSADGFPTQMPPKPTTPRPARASEISVPWIRALITGWI